MGAMRRLLLPLAVAVAVVVVVLLAADLWAAGTVESRIAEGVEEAVGQPARVNLGRSPVILRALTVGLPRVTVRAAGEGDDGALRSLDATLERVRVPPRALLASGDAWSAQRAHLRVAPRTSFFGNETLRVTAFGVEGAEHEGVSELRARTFEAAGEDGPPVQASGESVMVRSGERRPLRASLGAGTLEASDGAGELPLEAVALRLRARGVEIEHDDQRTRLLVEQLDVDADDVPLADGAVRMDRLEASFPDAQLDRRDGAGGTLTSPRGRFTARVAEATLRELWAFPGTVSFADDRILLQVGAVTLEAEAVVEEGALALRPVVPALAAPFVGELPTLRLELPVPAGAQLDDIRLRGDEVVLVGSAQRVALP
jgi:hypothetical protein